MRRLLLFLCLPITICAEQISYSFNSQEYTSTVNQVNGGVYFDLLPTKLRILQNVIVTKADSHRGDLFYQSSDDNGYLSWEVIPDELQKKVWGRDPEAARKVETEAIRNKKIQYLANQLLKEVGLKREAEVDTGLYAAMKEGHTSILPLTSIPSWCQGLYWDIKTKTVSLDVGSSVIQWGYTAMEVSAVAKGTRDSDKRAAVYVRTSDDTILIFNEGQKIITTTSRVGGFQIWIKK
ncbi:MAG: hypothetical protein J0I10_04780 [Verrucomicrobia bacterium]|nr:hypothetical protein [Verrucomicrobiota bacterium]